MRVLFYFDPVSSQAWITSQWIRTIAEEKNLKILWRPFSLALKNHVIDKEEMTETDYEQLASQRLLRVMIAAHKLEDADLGSLYELAGKRYHDAGKPYDDRAAEIMLNAAKLPLSLIESAESHSYDELIQDSMNDALSVVGKNVSIPIIVIDDKRVFPRPYGFVGPILKKLPNLVDSLTIWNSLFALMPLDVYGIYRSLPNSTNSALHLTQEVSD